MCLTPAYTQRSHVLVLDPLHATCCLFCPINVLLSCMGVELEAEVETRAEQHMAYKSPLRLLPSICYVSLRG